MAGRPTTPRHPHPRTVARERTRQQRRALLAIVPTPAAPPAPRVITAAPAAVIVQRKDALQQELATAQAVAEKRMDDLRVVRAIVARERDGDVAARAQLVRLARAGVAQAHAWAEARWTAWMRSAEGRATLDRLDAGQRERTARIAQKAVHDAEVWVTSGLERARLRDEQGQKAPLSREQRESARRARQLARDPNPKAGMGKRHQKGK